MPAAANPPRLWRLLGVGLSVALLAGCGSAVAASSHPTWVPQASPSAIPLPTPVPPGSSDSSGSSGGGLPQFPAPSATSSTGKAIDPNVVATKLNAPSGIAVLPDGTALVGERTTGRIVVVQPVAGKPVQLVKTLTGLDTRGGGGLLDLALSPTYKEDGLILALITTRLDTRVVHFTISGSVTSILTGIPRGGSDNVGRLSVAATGEVLVGTGDAGRPSRAADPASLAGKVLRVDELGRAAAGNPRSGSRVFTSGHRTVNGICTDPDTHTTYEVEAGATDELNILRGGETYGWPGGGGTAALPLPATGGVGDCAVAKGTLYVTGLGGQALFQAPLDARGGVGAFTPLLKGRYGRLLTVVAAEDDSLWITTANRDGHGRPVAADERVLHIVPSGGGGSPPV